MIDLPRDIVSDLQALGVHEEIRSFRHARYVLVRHWHVGRWQVFLSLALASLASVCFLMGMGVATFRQDAIAVQFGAWTAGMSLLAGAYGGHSCLLGLQRMWQTRELAAQLFSAMTDLRR